MTTISDFNLFELSSPTSFNQPLSVSGLEKDVLIEYLNRMVLIREVETTLAEGRRQGVIKGPVHLGVGQEAIAVGVSAFLNHKDMVFGAHRSHSHIIALGTDLFEFFSEILGRESGLCHGKGGSMHLSDRTVGFYGSVPIVAGTVSLAVGAAMASRLSSSSRVAVAYLGDGACEEGIVHESLNLASLYKEPILFVVENNLFASHMHISQRQPYKSTARFASAHAIPYSVVDGNNVIDVASAAQKHLDDIRNFGGPGFIEAVTFRWYGHVDWRDDIDVGVNRSQADIEHWRKKDPIKRLNEAMINSHSWSIDEYESLNSSLQLIISNAWNKALESSRPPYSALYQHVYSNS